MEGDPAQVMRVEKNIKLAAEHRLALGREMWALDCELGGLPEAITDLARQQIREQGEWKVAIGGVRDRVKHERAKVSRHKEAIGNLERESEKLWEAIRASSAQLIENIASIKREAKDSGQQLQERDVQAMVDLRKGIRWLRAKLEAVVEENGRHVLAVAEMGRAKEQLKAEVGELKQRGEVPEQDDRRLSHANEGVKGDVGQQ
jgi:hypothetical protein